MLIRNRIKTNIRKLLNSFEIVVLSQEFYNIPFATPELSIIVENYWPGKATGQERIWRTTKPKRIASLVYATFPFYLWFWVAVKMFARLSTTRRNTKSIGQFARHRIRLLWCDLSLMWGEQRVSNQRQGGVSVAARLMDCQGCPAHLISKTHFCIEVWALKEPWKFASALVVISFRAIFPFGLVCSPWQMMFEGKVNWGGVSLAILWFPQRSRNS